MGRPPSIDPSVPAVFLEQLGRDQVARAVRPPGQPLQVGPEDHDLVRAAATDRHELLVAADRDAMGIADRLALRVERERGDRSPSRRAATRVSRWPRTQPRSMLFLVVGKPPISHVGDVADLAVRR